jgi:hypothetical protein
MGAALPVSPDRTQMKTSLECPVVLLVDPAVISLFQGKIVFLTGSKIIYFTISTVTN